MSRSVSLSLREAMNAQETGEVVITLVRIEHDDLDGALLLSSDPTEMLSENPLVYGTVHGGEDYIFCPMEILLPDDIDERAPTARLMIANVGRELVAAVRSVLTPAEVTVFCVLASAVDDVEIEWAPLDLRGVQYNAETITIEIGEDAMDTEPFPARTFSASGFPALFK